jgi:hypothetical protein
MYDVEDGVYLAAAKRVGGSGVNLAVAKQLAGSSVKNLALFHFHPS